MMQQLVTRYRVCRKTSSSLHRGQVVDCSKLGNILFYQEYKLEMLYLFQPIDMTKSFKPSEEFTLFLKWAKKTDYISETTKICSLKTLKENKWYVKKVSYEWFCCSIWFLHMDENLPLNFLNSSEFEENHL